MLDSAAMSPSPSSQSNTSRFSAMCVVFWETQRQRAPFEVSGGRRCGASSALSFRRAPQRTSADLLGSMAHPKLSCPSGESSDSERLERIGGMFSFSASTRACVRGFVAMRCWTCQRRMTCAAVLFTLARHNAKRSGVQSEVCKKLSSG